VIGQKLGPYEIVGKLGQGGMGDVYAARDTRLDRSVAIKVVSEEFARRFEREGRALAAINHPNICTIYDVGPNYLVMELVDGRTLGQVLQAGPLSIADAVRYGGQIADALAAAHAHGIVHRDLKPGNIMVARGTIKVLDFGIATHWHPAEPQAETVSMGTAPGITLEGQIVGTPQYMSPEQAEGKRVPTCLPSASCCTRWCVVSARSAATLHWRGLRRRCRRRRSRRDSSVTTFRHYWNS
jgi:eukaryotic-like serine/threonine-protein kinase